MTALEQLNDYLRRFESRLRWLAASRGAAITGPLALVLTVLLVWIADHYRFAQNVVLPLRVLLFAALAAAIAFTLAIPLYKMNRRRVTRLAEQRVPGFGERLLTVTERPDPANPFTELVAEDAMQVARDHQPEKFATNQSLFALAGAGIGAAVSCCGLSPRDRGFGVMALPCSGPARPASTSVRCMRLRFSPATAQCAASPIKSSGRSCSASLPAM